MFRRVGVLNAPVSFSSLVTFLRPTSGSGASMPAPTLWYCKSVSKIPAPPVPVKLLVVADIPQGRAASRQLFLSCANGYGQPVGETVLVHVTRIAGTAPIDAEPFVEEQLPAKSRLFRRARIVRRFGHGLKSRRRSRNGDYLGDVGRNFRLLRRFLRAPGERQQETRQCKR